jgi:hypothetical protein
MFKNFKKIALSLLVVGLALTVQSFKNSQKIDPADIFVTVDGVNYTYLPSLYDELNCIQDTEVPCAFALTEEGAENIGRMTTFTVEDIETYENQNEWIIQLGSRTGIYDLN